MSAHYQKLSQCTTDTDSLRPCRSVCRILTTGSHCRPKPCSSGTRWGKPLTAALTLTFVADGIIDLDSSIYEWLPELS